MTKHPKFFIFDTGVFRSIRPRGPLDRPEEIEGAALETLFYQELRALNEYFELDFEISFWRTTTQLEVDLVAYGERGLFAFEIKRAAHVRSEDLRGLRAFRDVYPEAKTFCLYGGERPRVENGIRLIPYKTAITTLRSILTNEKY